MEKITWPVAFCFVGLMFSLVGFYGFADETATQERILGYVDTLVPFFVGLVSGGTVGGVLAFGRAKKII